MTFQRGGKSLALYYTRPGEPISPPSSSSPPYLHYPPSPPSNTELCVCNIWQQIFGQIAVEIRNVCICTKGICRKRRGIGRVLPHNHQITLTHCFCVRHVRRQQQLLQLSVWCLVSGDRTIPRVQCKRQLLPGGFWRRFSVWKEGKSSFFPPRVCGEAGCQSLIESARTLTRSPWMDDVRMLACCFLPTISWPRPPPTTEKEGRFYIQHRSPTTTTKTCCSPHTHCV